MKPRLFLTFSLFAVLLSSACASNATATQTVVEPSATALVVEPPSVDPTATLGLAADLSSATPPVDAQPAATSRGPELHATDPTTVSLASGQLQFVEFFRFT
ncbi:MAG TPA: hypothetical protein VNA23_10475 [Anaerolineales bacterium]|nr:hypothetical protein [Anaerolineales bacterium]